MDKHSNYAPQDEDARAVRGEKAGGRDKAEKRDDTLGGEMIGLETS